MVMGGIRVFLTKEFNFPLNELQEPHPYIRENTTLEDKIRALDCGCDANANGDGITSRGNAL